MGKGLNNCMSPLPTPLTLYRISIIWVFEYQPIASYVLTQPSHYKRAETNLLADKKVPKIGAMQLSRLYIYTYYIYCGLSNLQSLYLCLWYGVSVSIGRAGAFGCIIHQSPKSNNDVFLFVGLTTMWKFIKFRFVGSFT